MPPEVEPVRQSFLSWIFAALGFQYAILLALAGLLSFVVALIVVMRGKGPMSVVALLLIVHVPLLIGIFASIKGAMDSYTLIAMSSVSPKPSELAEGISTALVAPLVGMIVMVPGYAVAALGAFVRSLSGASNRAEEAYTSGD